MPELPEVETIRRQLAPKLSGLTVIEASSHSSEKFTPAREIEGARFGEMRRRGKFLITALDDGRELIIHLGMTGKLRLSIDMAEDNYTRAWWLLQDDAQETRFFEFNDVRRFGRIYVTKAGEYNHIGALRTMGPEPFDPALDATAFWKRLQKSKRKIKTQLLSQKPIAGVGNIYADEALWLARIHPMRTTLTESQATILLETIKEVLQKGIDNGGTTLNNYVDAQGNQGTNQKQLYAYGQAGEPCVRCDTPMISQQLDARTTTWCPHCQQL